MVVEDPRDLAAYETKEYKGLYHVLHGSISPMLGWAKDIKIKELLERLKAKR